jgi:uncharacterized protein (TIGR02466 family)
MNRKERRKEERQSKKVVEENPETFQMSYYLHRPWADILFETKLPPMVLEKMIEVSDKVLADSKRISWGNNLAGQIKEESLIPPEALKEHNLTDFFGNMVQEYVHQCNLQQAPSDQHQHMETVKNHIQVTVNSMWIVEQQPGEYNPIHTHTNCDISTVMYLKAPNFLPSEKTERDDDGTIYFLGSSSPKTKLNTNSLKVKPTPGAFFIFPSHLAHTVYPYKTNDNFARRSVSFNASFEYKK